MEMLASLHTLPSPLPPTTTSSSSEPSYKTPFITRRRAIISASTAAIASLLHISNPIPSLYPSIALQPQQVELDQEEDRIVRLFQETSPSVVFIEDLELAKIPKSSSKGDRDVVAEDEDAKVEGTGSGFIWDKFGHIVSISFELLICNRLLITTLLINWLPTKVDCKVVRCFWLMLAELAFTKKGKLLALIQPTI
uniref:Uncharacterized protein n=1 Tax=Gossypium raimondii TaxID=29730 RepID=A0A0D2UNX4_GOSRA|nr:hypothetical protein B456_011G045700 [Gossypium raimondii]